MYPSEFPTATQHDYDMDERGHWVCQICGHSVKINRGGTCIGVPIYRKWDDVPEGIATKTTLYKEHGLKLAPDQQPVGAKKQYNHRGKETGGYYPLFAIADATPKKKATPEQLKALEKARHMAERVYVDCVRCGRSKEHQYGYVMVTRKQWLEKYQNWLCHICKDKDRAIEWSKDILSDDNVVILDTETSDLDGECIEIAITDNKGNTLLNQRIKPLGEIAQGAYRVHGISLGDLQNEPMFPQVYARIKQAIEGKRVVIYNSVFDCNILYDDCERHELEQLDINDECAMNRFAEFVGDWSDYHGNYRWQPLAGGDHTALGDCLATLEVIKTMATYKKVGG